MVFSFFLRSAFSLDKETMRHVPDLSVQFFFSAMNTPSCSHLAEPRCSSNRLPSRDVRVSDFPVFAERLENGRQDMLTPEQMAKLPDLMTERMMPFIRRHARRRRRGLRQSLQLPRAHTSAAFDGSHAHRFLIDPKPKEPIKTRRQNCAPTAATSRLVSPPLIAWRPIDRGLK
jgi:hypothetical protein